MSFELPRRNQTGPNEWADVEANDQKLKEEIERVEGEVKAAPRPTAGVIGSEGEVIAGKGFTCTHLSAGKYKISLTTELSSVGAIVAMPLFGIVICMGEPAGGSKKDFEVWTITRSTGVVTNNGFAFTIYPT